MTEHIDRRAAGEPHARTERGTGKQALAAPRPYYHCTHIASTTSRTLTVLAALTAVLLTACGASSKPSGSGSSGSSRKALAVSNAYTYPACMRARGVTNFPDPQANGNTLTLQLTPSITGSPAFKSAQKTCAYLLPAGKGQINGLSPAQQALVGRGCSRSRPACARTASRASPIPRARAG